MFVVQQNIKLGCLNQFYQLICSRNWRTNKKSLFLFYIHCCVSNICFPSFCFQKVTMIQNYAADKKIAWKMFNFAKIRLDIRFSMNAKNHQFKWWKFSKKYFPGNLPTILVSNILFAIFYFCIVVINFA